VAARGRDARVKEGDAIFALLGRGRGSYAQYAIVKTNEFAAKPPGLSHPEAAAVPLAGLTAWQGLFDHGGLDQGQRVLIHGGAGGVGHLAIQFAAARGAFVTATVSDDDLIFARNLGAEQVIDYRHDRFEAQVEKVDLVFDLVDGEIQDRSFAVLKPGGRLVSTLRQPDEDKLRQYHVRGTNYMTQPNGAQLAAIAELIEQGKVRVEVSAIYPFEQAAEAQRHLEKCHVRGKIAIVMPG
jgi:NADPH:quinone reductase-like Zn-dependent oxidoreductase